MQALKNNLMTKQEAFKILDLPENVTILEIESKYKSLIKEFHPDKLNGNHEKAAKLNNAREFAIMHINDMSTSLAVIRQVAELIKLDNAEIIKRQEYKSQSEAIFSKATRKSINRYKQMQSITKLLGAFSAIIALITSNITPIFEKTIGNNPTFSIVFTGATFATGIYYLMFSTMTDRMKDLLDDFKETLDDKSSYYDIVKSILIENSELNKVFTRREFENNIKVWLDTSRHVMLEKFELDSIIDKDSLRRTARRIGETDFTKLIISKGLEKGIIKEVDLTENRLPTIGYSFETNKIIT